MVSKVVMLGVVVTCVAVPWLPVNFKMSLFGAVLYPVKTHVDGFWPFCLSVLFDKDSAVVLSNCIGVGCCGCPILCKQVLIGTNSWPLIYVTPISASAADPITLLIILYTVWMGPLRGGGSNRFLLKRFPPALLLACGADNYEALLWVRNTMSLAWYRIFAFVCVAT